MANLETKRRVMGRIDLATEIPTTSTRSSTKSPPVSTPNSLRRGSQARAKVDMSAFVGASAAVPSPPIATDSSTPPSNQNYFGRPLRQTTLSSLNSSPFLSASASPSASVSPSVNTRAGHFASISSNNGSHTAKARRSPSPIRQMTRNSESLRDIQAIAIPPIGITAKAPRVRNPSNGSGHARVNSTHIPAPSHDVSSRNHVRSPSLMSPFVNGPAHARVATSSTLASHNSSSSLIARSRSPSPTHSRGSVWPDRRESQSSANSSAVSASSSRPTPVIRTQRTTQVNGNAHPARPPLLSSVSNYSSTYSPSEVASGSLPSPSFASAMSRLVISHEQEDEEEESSYSNVTSPLQPAPLLSPSLELGPEALEAKKNRKILDLEITNRSLLAINSGLEVVKLKQVHEIRDLKKRIREGRSLGNKLGLIEDGVAGEGNVDAEPIESEDDEEAPLDVELEPAHNRCKSLIDKMVEQARQAILYKYEPESERKGGNRVLHPAEVEMMRGDATPIIASVLSDNEEGNLDSGIG